MRGSRLRSTIGIRLAALLIGLSAGPAWAAQTVYLDFDTYTGVDTGPGGPNASDYAYSPAEKALIKSGLEDIYAGFGVTFELTIPGSTHSTVYFNFGGGPYGGTSEHIDFLNVDPDDEAYVQAKDLLPAFAIPETSANMVQASVNLAAHELGHILGLRHFDSFGPPRGGIGVSPTGFDPDYPGPTGASTTSSHVMALASSVSLSGGTLLSPDLYFGFREAIKLSAMGLAPAPELPMVSGSPLTAQTLDFHTVSVFNSMAGKPEGTRFDAPLFDVEAVAIEGTISPTLLEGIPMPPLLTDYYKFFGTAGEIVQIEIFSDIFNFVNPPGTTPRYADTTDAVLFLLDSMGMPLDYYGAGAFSDDEPESLDPVLFDATLPYTGFYFIEVGPLDPFVPEHGGAYSLFVYKYTVPEPTSAMLLATGVGVMFARRRTSSRRIAQPIV